MPTLYLTNPGSRLELSAGQLLCVQDDEILVAAPAARVDQVVVVGGSHVTTPALAYLLDRNIDVVFVTAGGRFRGRLESGDFGALGVRREQYRRADDPDFSLKLSKDIVHGKLRNCRTRCMELDETGDPPSARAIERLQLTMAEVPLAVSHADLMGIEGRGARLYFSVLRRHLRKPWTFEARARRPPPDPVNAMLSLVYTLLHEHCRSALVITDLDPALGFLHKPRPGRSSLALDLMEEFRPVIADTVVWAMFNKRILAPADFIPAAEGRGIRLTPDGWRKVAKQYNRRLDTGILVPGRKTRTTYRKLMEVQARRLRNVIIGKNAEYEPYASR